jgi:hypothetical protein
MDILGIEFMVVLLGLAILIVPGLMHIPITLGVIITCQLLGHVIAYGGFLIMDGDFDIFS